MKNRNHWYRIEHDSDDPNCHCEQCLIAGTRDQLLRPKVNLLRELSLVEGDDDERIVAQLPIWASTSMNVIAARLIEELDGHKGLFYTAEFKWQDAERVEEFFIDLGYEINHIDKRPEQSRRWGIDYAE